MIIAMNMWLALNIVFGIWTTRNIFVRVYSILVGGKYSQSDLGKILDMVVISSVIAYCLTTGII